VTKPNHLIHLRRALQTDEGTDRDVTAPFSAFLKYQRNGLDVTLRFAVGSRLTREELKSCKTLLDKEALLEAGMSLNDKLADVSEQAARLLLVHSGDTLVGLVHWRFSLQGELVEKMEGDPVLLLCDLWLAPQVQRKGLGTHLLNLLTLAAKSVDMCRLMVGVYTRMVPAVVPFLLKQKGAAYTADAAWSPSADAGLLAYSKPLRAQAAAPVPDAKAACSPDSVLAAPAALEPPPPVALAEQFASLSVGEPAEAPFWERVAAPSALEVEDESEDASSDDDDNAGRVLDELCAMFEDKHGRLPTAEEVEMWKATLAEAASEAASLVAPLD